MKRGYLVLAGSVLVAASSGHAGAAITFYANQASFNAALASFSVDTYDDLPAYSPLSATIARTTGPYSYTAHAANNLYTAGIGADIWLSTNNGEDPMVLTPTVGLPSAMGGFFFTSDINGAPDAGDLQITVIDVNGTQNYSLINTNPATFLGFITDSSIVQVSVLVSSSPIDVWPTINDLIIGQAIPTPGAAGLLALGGLCAARRRR